MLTVTNTSESHLTINANGVKQVVLAKKGDSHTFKSVEEYLPYKHQIMGLIGDKIIELKDGSVSAQPQKGKSVEAPQAEEPVSDKKNK